MRKSVLLIAAIAVFSLSAIVINTKQDKMKNFRWLEGSWVMKRSNGSTIIETWVPVNDSTMGGEGINISVSGRTTIKEKLKLTFRRGLYYYEAIALGQNNDQPVLFKMTAYSEKGFVAENPQHDFPKRISYTLVRPDSVYVVVDGGPAAADKKTAFYFSKNKN
jgi:hypothetical protein